MTETIHANLVPAFNQIPRAEVFTFSEETFADPDPDAVRITNTDAVSACDALALVECATEAPVAQVQRCPGASDVPLSMRGGVYPVAGLGSVEAGAPLSLRPMRAIHIDPAEQTVRIAADVRAGEPEAEFAPNGLCLNLPVPSAPSVTGAAHSCGVGFTLRNLGSGSDAMLRAGVVIADGSVIAADDERTPELMWALRGGAPTVGVVVEATFQSAPISHFTVMQSFYGVEDIPDGLRFMRDWGATVSDNVTHVATVRNLTPHPAIAADRHRCPGLTVPSHD